MITRFLRKRNVNTNLPFSTDLTRIQVSSGSNTFSYKKLAVSAPSGNTLILTEAGLRLTSESGAQLAIN